MSCEGILEALGSEFSVSWCRKRKVESGIIGIEEIGSRMMLFDWYRHRKHQGHTKQSLWISMICEWIWVNVTTKLIPSFFLRISPTFSTLLALGLTLLIPPGTLAAYGSSWCWVLESTECLSWTFLDILSPDFGRVWQMSLQWLLCLRKALFIVRPNQKKIAEMAAMKQSCTVLRDNKWKERAWRHGMSPNLRRKTEVTA